MKFLELNKKRHAVKTFNDKAVDYKDLRTAIEIATLAPSANNIQPWKFVVIFRGYFRQFRWSANLALAGSSIGGR